ncbi:MAG: PASTA domain-containing protein [Solirubrobacteraceae bacterium]|nr:PASTA domain-containing protein [Solirubrobacteraceae bacterium]
MNPVRFLCALAAILALAAFPAVASASCLTSTPSSFAIDDPVDDAQFHEYPGADPTEVLVVSAPEITRLTGSMDGACTLALDATLALPPGETEPLVQRESLRYDLDVDANPATGGTVTGAEWRVLVDGNNGPDTVQLLRWNGYLFAEARPIPAAGSVGFSVPLSAIGVTAPGPIGVRLNSRMLDGSEALLDTAPNRDVPQLLFALGFAVPAPPPPPVVTPPVVKPPVVAASTCKVPSVKGLTTARAVKKLKTAGCRTQLTRKASKTRKGRVLSTLPAAGKTTTATVKVTVSSGPRKARRRG